MPFPTDTPCVGSETAVFLPGVPPVRKGCRMSKHTHPTSNPAIRRRAIAAAVVLTCLLATVIRYAAAALHTGRGFPCPFRALTGCLCPGCGMTHALAALFRLNIREALVQNALFPAYISYFGWLIGSATRRYVRTGSLAFPMRPLPVHIGALVLFLCYGILRNLP